MTRDGAFKVLARPGLLVAAVAVAAALPFVGALGGPFLWDDTHLIENNPRVHTLARISHFFTHSFFDTGSSPDSHFLAYYRPLSHLSFATDWAIGGGNPAVFHATNLLLAMVVAGLAADGLMRWTRSTYPALFGALLFAWHPTKAESVAWISGRTDLLLAAFMLLACKARSKHLGRGGGWGALELVATLLAYASKESAVVLPFFIALEHWSAAGQPPLGRATVWSLIRNARLQWCAAIGYLALRSQVFPLVPLGQTSTEHPLLSTRVGLVLETLGHAAHLLVYPFPQSAEHGLAGFDERGQLIVSGKYALLGGSFLVACLACAWLTRKRAPAISLGTTIILFTLLPTANLIPTHLQSAFAERFLFLPSLGMALVIAALGSLLPERRTRRAPVAVALTVLALFGVRSMARAEDYASANRFWKHERVANSLSTIAPQGLAGIAIASGDVEAALVQLDQCHTNAVVRRQHRTAIRCAYDGAILSADKLADLDQESLVRAARFFRALAIPDGSGVTELHLPKMAVSIDTSVPAVRSVVHELAGESLAMLASIELRLKEGTATTHARSAISHCGTCRYTLRAARVLAAGGHLDEALTVVGAMQRDGSLPWIAEVEAVLRQYAYWNARSRETQGAVQVHARAQALLTLGLYGEAYGALKPHAGEFAHDPAVTRQYARVAYYAGDTSAARDALLHVLDPEATDKLLMAWGKNQAEVSE